LGSLRRDGSYSSCKVPLPLAWVPLLELLSVAELRRRKPAPVVGQGQLRLLDKSTPAGVDQPAQASRKTAMPTGEAQAHHLQGALAKEGLAMVLKPQPVNKEH
jgi:hypothetical protein